MPPVVITTARLVLTLQTPGELLASIEALSPEDRAEVSPAWIARVKQTQPGDVWALGFVAMDRATGATIGHCGFKGPPDADGVVEIAYGIDESHRNLGLATEAAAALTAFALASERVHLVRAHTKSDHNASARVLTKCGFRLLGDVIDPEDGLVCRWEISRNAN
jgi:RimJ/RimL family protein N-acetyltransferase